MLIPVLINGAHGKMGQITAKTLACHADFSLVKQTGRSDDLVNEIKKSGAKIVIDFTNAHSVYDNTKAIIESGAHPIIGTSGLTKEQIQELQKQCAELRRGGIIAPNFSLGAVLMMKYAQEVAKYFPQVEIIEMHHDGKLDSPSGTAVRTAEMIAATRKEHITAQKTLRETLPGARGASYQNISIHAIRLPGLVAHQQILFGGLGETLSIKHDSIDRQCFMPGVVLACKKVMELNELVIGLEHIL